MITYGSDIKISVNIEPISGLSMSGYDFECTFFIYDNRRVTVTKKQMEKVDDDHYIAAVYGDSARILGRGKLMMEVTAYIPAPVFPSGFRTEKAVVWTGETVV